ncbi:MAG: hypothetical protein HYX83_03420 [Chloroflexi bacterium]|nr:hypothetical protein [Chloroflexota bacterium]
MHNKEDHMGDSDHIRGDQVKGDQIKIERPFQWGVVLIVSVSVIVVGAIAGMAIWAMSGRDAGPTRDASTPLDISQPAPSSSPTVPLFSTPAKTATKSPIAGSTTPSPLPAQGRLNVNMPTDPLIGKSFRFWQDPNEKAFKILLPEGWDITGGIQRVNTDPTYQLDARKGKARFFLQNPVPVQHWAPTQYTAMMGYREGTYIPALGFQFFLLRYHPPRQYISDIILASLKQQYPDIRIVEMQDLPEVARAYKDPSATNAEAASATLAFTDGGVPMKAGYTVWNDYFAGPEGSAAWVARVIGVIAPEAEFQTTSKLLAWALSTIKIEPAWLQAEVQGSAERQKMVRATTDRIREMEYKMFTEERNINLKIGGNWMEALGPNMHARDMNGNPVVLPNPGAGNDWGQDSKGGFQPFDRNNRPKGIDPVKPR